MSSTLKVRDDIYLSSFSLDDVPNIVEAMEDQEISINTLRIPYPYQEQYAIDWIKAIPGREAEFNSEFVFAIREHSGKAIGSISRHFQYGVNSHQDEIGYWLNKNYRGQGIMSDTIRTFCDYWFEKGLARMTATIFPFNPASGKALVKAGFEREGYLRKNYLKNGAFIDGILYAKVKE
jgi:RimJ/RimL family protein N-acetyltransferase